MWLDDLPVAYFFMGPGGIIGHGSERFANMVGFSRKELAGLQVGQLISPASHKLIDCWIKDCVVSPGKPIEVALMMKSGGGTWAQLAHVQSRQSTATDGLHVMATDINDRVRGEAELISLAANLAMLEDRERARLAADLHDGLGQSLTLIMNGLDQAIDQLQAGNKVSLSTNLKMLHTRTKYAINEMRSIAAQKCPSMVDELGIVAALSWLRRQFETDYREIKIHWNVDVVEVDIALQQKTALFRIVQEALHNVSKYSHASVVILSLRRVDDQLELCIGDNGCGFDPEEVTARSRDNRGSGLSNIRDRAIAAGGTHLISAGRVGGGVDIRILLPVTQIDSGCDPPRRPHSRRVFEQARPISMKARG